MMPSPRPARRAEAGGLRPPTVRWAVALALVAGWVGWGAPPVPDPSNRPGRVAFSASLFVDINENDARAAVAGWAEAMSQEHGIRFDPDPLILDGMAAILRALRENQVDAVALTTEECWRLDQALPLGPFIFGIRGGVTTEQYLLLVAQDSPVKQLADLRGRSLAVFQNPRASLAPVWLETRLAQAGLGRLEQFFGEVKPNPKLTGVVLPVFFHQADACLVTRLGLETMSELNPQVGRQVRVLAASPALVPSVFCFVRGRASTFREQVLPEITQLHRTPAGRQVLLLFQSDRLEEYPKSYLEGAFQLLAAHRRLCEGVLADGGGVTNGVATASPPVAR